MFLAYEYLLISYRNKKGKYHVTYRVYVCIVKGISNFLLCSWCFLSCGRNSVSVTLPAFLCPLLALLQGLMYLMAEF